MFYIINVPSRKWSSLTLAPFHNGAQVGMDASEVVGLATFVNDQNAENSHYLLAPLNGVSPRDLVPTDFEWNQSSYTEVTVDLGPDSDPGNALTVVLYDEDLECIIFNGQIDNNLPAPGETSLFAKACLVAGIIASYNFTQDGKLHFNLYNEIRLEREISLTVFPLGTTPTITQTDFPVKTVDGVMSQQVFSERNTAEIVFNGDSNKYIIQGTPYYEIIFNGPRDATHITVNGIPFDLSKLEGSDDFINPLFNFHYEISDSFASENDTPEEFSGKNYKRVRITTVVPISISVYSSDRNSSLFIDPSEVIDLSFTQKIQMSSGDAISYYPDIAQGGERRLYRNIDAYLTSTRLLDISNGTTEPVTINFKEGSLWWLSVNLWPLNQSEPVTASSSNFQELLGPDFIIGPSDAPSPEGVTSITFAVSPNLQGPPSMPGQPVRPNGLVLGLTETNRETYLNVEDFVSTPSVEIIDDTIQMGLLAGSSTGDCVPVDISFGSNEALPTDTTNIHLQTVVEGTTYTLTTTYQANDTPRTAFDRMIRQNEWLDNVIYQQFEYVERTIRDPILGTPINEVAYAGVSTELGNGIGDSPVTVTFARSNTPGSFDLYGAFSNSLDATMEAHSCGFAIKGPILMSVGAQDDGTIISGVAEGRSIIRVFDPMALPELKLLKTHVTPVNPPMAPATANTINAGEYVMFTNEILGEDSHKDFRYLEIFARGFDNVTYTYMPFDVSSSTETVYVGEMGNGPDIAVIRNVGNFLSFWLVTKRGDIAYGQLENGKFTLKNMLGFNDAVSVSINMYSTILVVGHLVDAGDLSKGVTYTAHDLDQETGAVKPDVTYTVAGEWATTGDNTVTSMLSWIDRNNFTYSTTNGIVLATTNPAVGTKSITGKLLVKPETYPTANLSFANLVLLNFGNDFVVRVNDPENNDDLTSHLLAGKYDRSTSTLTFTSVDLADLYLITDMVDVNSLQFVPISGSVIAQNTSVGPDYIKRLGIDTNGRIIDYT